MVLLASACLTPPALLPAKTLELETALALYPPDSERVELHATSGATLRGVYVPAGPDAPLVLHLLDSSGSWAAVGADYAEVATRLADMGFASLLCDYEGVGASSGTRSVRNLLPDAECLWAEALRRVDGDPRRVLIRAVSIGTLPAVQLVAHGARPRALLLIAPVFPETVTMRFAQGYLNPLFWLASIFLFRPVARFDPCATIASAGVPCSALSSSHDPLLSDDERARLASAVKASGGAWLDLAGDHLWLGISARRLGAQEGELLGSLAPEPEPEFVARRLAELPEDVGARLPPDSAERTRFAELARNQRGANALELAAAALANDDWRASDRMLWLARRRPYPQLAFDDHVAALSLRAPAPGLSPDVIEFLSAPLDLAWRYDRGTTTFTPELVGQLAAWGGRITGGKPLKFKIALHCGLTARFSFTTDKRWDGLAAEMSAEDASCCLARELLKGLRIPERAHTAENGTPVLEALWDGAWQAVPCAPRPELVALHASARATSQR